VAAGAAWFVAAKLLHHATPVLAPLSAIIVLGAAAGQRWQRAVELVLGVALGIAVADLIVLGIGVGPIQVAVVVLLAILVSIFLGGSGVLVGQAASSAVLVAATSISGAGRSPNRFVDALLGGSIGLLVLAVLPYNALNRVRRDAGRSLDLLAEAFVAGAEALEQANPRRARRSLDALFGAEEEYVRFRDSLTQGKETTVVSPLRWSSRTALRRYTDAAVHIERATRNARVMHVWIVSAIREREPVHASMPEALRLMAKAVVVFRRDLFHDDEPVQTREIIYDAVREIWSAYRAGVGFSSRVVLAQVRGAVVDLLIAADLTPDEAEAAARKEDGPKQQEQ
jgi:uncharacterized membrane protein YgaE (UPF0421/DUF939 family)